MFDTTVFEISTGIALVSIALYSFVFIYAIIYYRQLQNAPKSINKDLFWLLYFILFAVTYAIDSDFFHYKEMVQDVSGFGYVGLEEVYHYIIEGIHNNYLLFRIIIFGSAILLYSLVLKINDANKTVGLILLLICFGGSYSYARASLAFTLYYLGLSLLINDTRSRSLFSKIIGCALIISSFFFHRSMALLIVLTPFTFVKFNKKRIIALLLLAPIVVYLALRFMGPFFNILEFDETIEKRMELYGGYTQAAANWKGVIGTVCHYGMYVICFYMISKCMLKEDIRNNLPNSIKRLYSFYTILLYVSILMYYIMGNNILFMHRYLKMSVVPACVIIAFLYKNNYIKSKSLLYLLLFAGFSAYWGFMKYIV